MNTLQHVPNPSHARRCPPRRSALTLAELVAVLTILAVTATVAVQSLKPRVDQSRFDATQQTLLQIELAILGSPPSRNAISVSHATGFVADIGRLPNVASLDARLALAELWNNDKDQNGLPDLTPFSVQTPPGDPQVRLAAGWRGPYLRLPIGARGLQDGWGNPLVPLSADGTTPIPGAVIAQLVSLGSDRNIGGVDFATDLGISFQTAGPAGFDLTRADLVVHVFYTDTSQNPQPDRGGFVVCRLYGPDGQGRVTTLAAEVAPVTDTTTPITFTLTNISRGPRVVRVYQVAQPPADDDTPLDLIVGGSAVSVPLPIYVSGQSETLILHDY